MRKCIPFVLLALILSSCEEKPSPISVQVFPAVFAADARGEATAWDSVGFAGSERSPEGAYRVAPEPLFTEWNIIAFRAAAQPNGKMAVAARLNAYAARKLQEFSRDPANLKKPLAVRVNGRRLGRFQVPDEWGEITVPIPERVQRTGHNEIKFSFAYDVPRRTDTRGRGGPMVSARIERLALDLAPGARRSRSRDTKQAEAGDGSV